MHMNSFVSIYDSPAIKIIRRELNRNFVSRKNTNEILAHFAGNVRQDLMLVFKFHPEHGVWQRLNHCGHYLNRVFSAHSLLESASSHSLLASSPSISHLTPRAGSEKRDFRQNR